MLYTSVVACLPHLHAPALPCNRATATLLVLMPGVTHSTDKC